MSKQTKRYSDDPAYQIPLSEDQLQELGKLFAIWGQIDFQIILVIAAILKIETAAAIALLDNVTSGTLVSHLRKRLDNVSDPQDREEIKNFCELMGSLVDKRNHLSHGIWGWEVSDDAKMVSPACYYAKASNTLIRPNDLKDLCRRIMAESHAINAVVRRYLKIPPNPELATSPFFFARLGGQPPHDWYAKAPLQPGMDHRMSD